MFFLLLQLAQQESTDLCLSRNAVPRSWFYKQHRAPNRLHGCDREVDIKISLDQCIDPQMNSTHMRHPRQQYSELLYVTTVALPCNHTSFCFPEIVYNRIFVFIIFQCFPISGACLFYSRLFSGPWRLPLPFLCGYLFSVPHYTSGQ